MTPRRADLFDVVEGQNLGVEVADGHVIKCSITGKIRLQMTDDNGDALNAVLHDIMYVPGLSRRLFSITRFARHGHFATIRSGSTTLYFGEQQSPVTLSSNGSRPMAADVTVVSTETKAHAVPANRNHDHSANKTRTGLELLHQRLGHRKCRAILAASEHGVWADTMVCKGPEDECVSCEVSTARASNRNKEAHTGGNYPGEYIFLDILHPVVPVGLTKKSTFPFSLILVDAYSRYACIYGIRDKSSSCVIDTLTRYQADHGHIGNYGYLDIARIRADSGSQFTSENFREHCRMAGINLTLAAPKKHYQNHLAERSWQTISTMARSLLVHARLPDSFMFHALLYSCHIFNVLPVKGLYLNGHMGTPYELFQGAKPAISQFRVFGCPVTARKWTTKQSSAGKQTQGGIRGIFIGFAENQKGYLFYSPASRQIYVSGDVTFDETFSSTIATTWRLHRDNLAIRPATSDIPIVTTTLEHTGSVDDTCPNCAVEEGEKDEINNDEPPPPLVPIAELPESALKQEQVIATSHNADEWDDDCPDLSDADDDSLSEADSFYDSDSDDDLDDDVIADLEQPGVAAEEDVSPQPANISRYGRVRRPNSRYAYNTRSYTNTRSYEWENNLKTLYEPVPLKPRHRYPTRVMLSRGNLLQQRYGIL
jgi:transposase InsO family protein